MAFIFCPFYIANYGNNSTFALNESKSEILYMVKKRTKTKAQSQSVNYKKAIGLDAMFANEKTNFTVGFTILMLAIYIIMAFFSYFNTAAEDQSLVMHPVAGDLTNTSREFIIIAAHTVLIFQISLFIPASDFPLFYFLFFC